MNPTLRKRLACAICCLGVVVLGLLSRSKILGLPPFAAKYVGDALWALMVFVGAGALLPTWPTPQRAFGALALSCAVEFSQLYHAPWIDAIRATRIGALALGSFFSWWDMIAYMAGVATGVVLACAWSRSVARLRA